MGTIARTTTVTLILPMMMTVAQGCVSIVDVMHLCMAEGPDYIEVVELVVKNVVVGRQEEYTALHVLLHLNVDMSVERQEPVEKEVNIAVASAKALN